MALLRDFMYPPITRQRFESVRAAGAKRICFGTTHRNALKRANGPGSAYGFFNVPFDQTIREFFPWGIFANKKGNYGGYYRTIKSSTEFEQIQKWMEEYSDLVFIKSALSSAVAACEHYNDTGRSPIGELENAAKYGGNGVAQSKLVDVLESAYRRLFSKGKIHALASVPPSVAGTVSLPNFLAAQLATRLDLPDLTDLIAWNGPKPSLKELPVDQKWAALEGVGLRVSSDVRSRNILLIDDMYQSGATVHFVASQVRAAGANHLHVLAVSKGRRDTDNT